MQGNARIWDRFAPRYFQTPIKDQAVYKYKLELTRRYMTADTRLLELGCGTGGTAVLHAPYVRDVLAVDFSEKMLELARARSASAGIENIRFAQCAVEDFDAGEPRFDMVLALSLLHLLEDLDLGIECIRQTLKPNGFFVSSTACLAEHYGFLRYLGPLGRKLGLLPMLRVFSEGTLRASLERAGFHIEEYWKPDGKKSHVVFIVARRSDA